MKKIATIGLLSIAVCSGFTMFMPVKDNHREELATENSKIQIAILFDTSNSMDGLIDQAKARIWSIVNTMSNLRHNQQVPTIEIALYEYGNDGLDVKGDYVRQILPLSTDLDIVSENLFKLKTNGGSEFCGAVISKAVNDLKWSTNSNDIRLLYIAGNEPFDQGSVDYKKICTLAAERDIKVHTIYCGDYESGKRELWYHGAQLGKGEYSNINSDQEIVHYDTPFDQQINFYNDSLNGTYIYYGKTGEANKTNMMMQDVNASVAGGSADMERTAVKSKASYNNASWDLVDAKNTKKEFKISELKEEELPKELRGKTKEEKEKYVALKAEDRKRYQENIQELTIKREKFIAEIIKNSPKEQESDLGVKINKTIYKIAEEKGFEIEK